MVLAKGPVLLMTTICWKRLSFTQRMVLAPSSKIIWPVCTRAYFWLSVLFHWSICRTLCQWKWSAGRSVVSDSSQAHELYRPWNFPGQNTGVGSCSLLQGVFPTQGSNPGLPYCGWILYQLSHKRSPRILEWVAYPFSSRSSQPRNWTAVSCIAGGFFTNWVIREATW